MYTAYPVVLNLLVMHTLITSKQPISGRLVFIRLIKSVIQRDLKHCLDCRNSFNLCFCIYKYRKGARLCQLGTIDVWRGQMRPNALPRSATGDDNGPFDIWIMYNLVAGDSCLKQYLILGVKCHIAYYISGASLHVPGHSIAVHFVKISDVVQWFCSFSYKSVTGKCFPLFRTMQFMDVSQMLAQTSRNKLNVSLNLQRSAIEGF